MKRIREVIAPEHKPDTTLPHEPFKDGADVRRHWELHAPQAAVSRVLRDLDEGKRAVDGMRRKLDWDEAQEVAAGHRRKEKLKKGKRR